MRPSPLRNRWSLGLAGLVAVGLFSYVAASWMGLIVDGRAKSFAIAEFERADRVDNAHVVTALAWNDCAYFELQSGAESWRVVVVKVGKRWIVGNPDPPSDADHDGLFGDHHRCPEVAHLKPGMQG